MISEPFLHQDYYSKDSSYFEVERPEMLHYIPANASMILEVGCGSGAFGQCLKEKLSAQVWGVEPEPQAAALAAQKLDQVICDVFNSGLELPRHSFDCIVFNDVLEHFIDPCSALLYCKELLRDQGVVVASIPNVRYFHNLLDLVIYGNWQYCDYGILDRTHLRFFTYRSIVSTFEGVGYQVEMIQGINPIQRLSLPGRFRYFNFLLRLFAERIEDTRYLQFAIVAKPIAAELQENRVV